MDYSYDLLLYTTPPPSSSTDHTLVIGIVIVYTFLFVCCCFTCYKLNVFHFILNFCQDPLKDSSETAVPFQEPSCVVLGPPDVLLPCELRGIVIVTNTESTG